MILRLAIRNLLRHRRSSLIIMAVIALITCLFALGNSLLASSERGLRQSYVYSYTGDLVVMPEADFSLSLFGANTPAVGEYYSLPTLPAREELEARLGDDARIADWTAQLSGLALVDLAGFRRPMPVFGIDPEEYFAMFPALELLRGKRLQAGEYGVMLSRSKVSEIEAEIGRPVRIGEPVLFSSFGNQGFSLREVPLVGIHTYVHPTPVVEEIVLMDPATFRALNRVFIAPDDPAAIAYSDSDLIDEGLDSLFDASADQPGEAEGVSVLELFNTDGNSNGESLSLTPSARPEFEGGWNFLLLRTDAGIDRIHELLADLPVRVVDWRRAAGPSALLVLLVQFIYNGGLMLVALAGIIAMVNILLIAVFERKREIGTLRALGAPVRYVRLLFLVEQGLLALSGGGVGLLIARLATVAINQAGIEIANQTLASLLGGYRLAMDFPASIAAGSIILALTLGLGAGLYPVHRASRIEPIVALERR